MTEIVRLPWVKGPLKPNRTADLVNSWLKVSNPERLKPIDAKHWKPKALKPSELVKLSNGGLAALGG